MGTTRFLNLQHTPSNTSTMKKFLNTPLSAVLLLLIILPACKSSNDSPLSHSGYHQRVAAFTSALLPTNGSITVEFTDSVTAAVPGMAAPSSLASIQPAAKGDWLWLNERTLQFKPSENFEAGRLYKITLHLKKLFPDEKEDFFFNISTLPQNYRLKLNPLELETAESGSAYRLSGSLQLANAAVPAQVKDLLKAQTEAGPQEIRWQQSDEQNYHFEIGPLQRGETESTLTLEHNGAVLGSENKGKEKIPIPAKGQFVVQHFQSHQHPRQLIQVVFSDPLDAEQNFDGLVQVDSETRLSFLVRDNVLEIYPSSPVYGDFELRLTAGISSSGGPSLGSTERFQFSFSSLAPAVEFVGKGNIMPYSDQLHLPFRAVALKSVLVRVVRIYENNLPAFLQINTLEGSQQLKRAGRLVHQSLLPLNTDATLNLNDWNTFSLDLSKMIQAEPGALYRVELGFERADAAFACGDEVPEARRNTPEDGDFWDEPEGYYQNYPYQYQEWDWYERDNPCSDSYYRRNRWASTNILASNLGLLAKKGDARELLVFANDLRSTAPLAEVELEVLNFQLQSLAKGRSDTEGKALLQLKGSGQPFLLLASQGKQKAYLRLDEGHSLSLSRFDVDGQQLQEGLKGYLYGERGVWRPGDSLFVSLMVEDKNGQLPPNQPATFELINPRGQIQQRLIARHPQNRLYSFRAATPEDAPTGFWLARVSVGPAVFEQDLRIETIKPNRLRIDLLFEQERLQARQSTKLELQAEWLHGAVAGGLKADLKLSFSTVPTRFTQHPAFVFDDALRKLEQREETLFEGRLDEQGKASINFDARSSTRAPGMMLARFSSRVYEEGGSFSMAQHSRPFSPYPRYVGLRAPETDQKGYLLTDETHPVEVVWVDEQGEASGDTHLKYRIYKLDWRWWWDKTEDDLARYVSSGSASQIKEGSVKITQGKGSLPFRIDQPDWGRYLIRVEDPVNGHAATTTVLVDWPGWAQKASRGGSDGATMLQFNSDKRSYAPGEKALITFPSAGQGRALVSVENGSRVLQSWWVETQAESTRFEFTLTEEMIPGIYVSVTLLQPHLRADNDLPIRLFGVLPLEVNHAASRLQPQIKAAEEWRPQQRVEVEVSETKGRALSYTLAIVDDGLLDLTAFKTPDAWPHFNAREALGVKTWDLYDQVLGAFGGRIEQVFGIGGGDELSTSGTQNQARRFEPMVRFLGPFDLKAKDKNKHNILLPNYTGSVRIMLVASDGEATGAADKRVKIRQPLMVWSSLPRVMGPGEELLLPVTLFASGKAVGPVQLQITGDDLLRPEGPAAQTVHFEQEGEQTVYFKLRAAKATGSARIEIKATAGGETASQTVHLPVRNPNPPQTRVSSLELAPGAEALMDYELFGALGTNSASLEVSSIPPIDFGRRLKFLLQYPHGCIEQISSGAFPQLYLPQLAQLSDEAQRQARSNVQSVLNRLLRYQTNDGGFAYWPGGTRADEWASSYAGHLLLEAENKGYPLPPQLKERWLNFQSSRARSWTPGAPYEGQDFIQAYRLFTLALAGSNESGSMNRLRRQENLSAAARWRLAAAYALTGLPEVARELSSQLPENAAEGHFDATYGSEERDMAMLIESLVLMNRRTEAAPLVRELSHRLNRSTWMSTQTTAYALLAVSAYVGEGTTASRNSRFNYRINQAAAEKITFEKALLQERLELEKEPAGQIRLQNESPHPLFVQLILNGQPLEDSLRARSASGLGMRITYTDLDNRPLDITRLEQGTDFKAVVTLSNQQSQTLSNLALTQIFPSGWEIRNTRMEESLQQYELDLPTYRDVRDDRAYSYLDLRRGQSQSLVLVLHASYAGRFWLPAVSCAAMYDHNIQALEPGLWVEVLAPGENK